MSRLSLLSLIALVGLSPRAMAQEDCDPSAVFLLVTADADAVEVSLDTTPLATIDVTARIRTAFDRGFVQGWAISVSHDPTRLELLEVTDEGNTFDLEFITTFHITEIVDNETGTGFVSAMLPPDFLAPGQIPSIGDFDMAFATYRPIVPSPASGIDAGDGLDIVTTLEWTDGLRGSGQPVRNVITWEGRTLVPCARTLPVTLTRPGSRYFRRGDANLDGRLDVSDPVTILRSQFHGDAPIRCDDAADTNDDGQIDISDASYAFNYLFLGGSAPPEPFARTDGDPTPDSLDCRP